MTNLLTKESTQLRRLLGRPILMVFYHADSTTVEPVLRFAQTVQNKYRQHVWVLGFAVSDDVKRIQKQHSDLQLSLPIYSGKGLRQTYGVEATPKLVIRIFRRNARECGLILGRKARPSPRIGATCAATAARGGGQGGVPIGSGLGGWDRHGRR